MSGAPASATCVSLVSATTAIVLSLRHIQQHLSHFHKPRLQRHVVRILALVPLYSLTSALSLLTTDALRLLMLQLLRDSYEAYVVYNFVSLLILYAGGDACLCRYLEACPRMHHSWPLSLRLAPLPLGPAFVHAVRWGVFQFILFKPLAAAARLYAFEHATEQGRACVRVVVAVIQNISIACALYALVLFYRAADELLRPHRPFAKFLSVKAVVFFSFWQGVALSLLVSTGVLSEVRGVSVKEQVTGMQHVLICVEMAVAAVLHYHVFPWEEYQDGKVGVLQEGSQHPLLRVVDFRDVLKDARDRFYGGVAFESELRDCEPIVPSTEVVLADIESVELEYVKELVSAGGGGFAQERG